MTDDAGGRQGSAVPTDAALTDALAVAMQSFGRLSNEDVRRMRAARRRTARSAAAMLIVGGLGIAGMQALRVAPPTTTHYATARGEQRTVRLADGSTVRLNGATRIAVTFDKAERRVELAQGEAFFDVTHDADRPFVATVGDVSGEVLGTAFDLNRTHGQVELDVYRGAVRFVGKTPGVGGTVVRAGWRSRYRGGVIDRPTAFDPGQQDWRQGWIDTDGMLLGEMVEALNRGGGPVVRQPAPELAAIPIGGRFRLDDPERLLRTIGKAYGFATVREANTISLRSTGHVGGS